MQKGSEYQGESTVLSINTGRRLLQSALQKNDGKTVERQETKNVGGEDQQMDRRSDMQKGTSAPARHGEEK